MSLRDSLGTSALPLVGPCLCLLAACGKETPSVPAPAPDPRLEGYWEGDGGSGTVSVTIEGDSLHYYEQGRQYDTTFTLVPGTDPRELHVTIIDSPRTSDNAGEMVVAIYEFEDDILNLAAVDKVEGEPASFDRASNHYRLERAQPPD